ncbi:MAG: ABC transporter ATP-binding protein [bacterium]
MKILDIKNINFSYYSKKKEEVFSLSGINFSIIEKEFISILGANGSGKSTLLKIIAGILKQNEGTIFINEKDKKLYSINQLAKIIAYVPQLFFSVYPFSVYEIVMMGRTPYLNMFGYENKNDKEIVLEMLNKVGIYHLRNKGINEVSGGEAQRAYIARALVQKPKIILLDEPNSHLDIKNEIYLFGLLDSLRINENLSIVIITHHLNLANYYSTRVVLFKDGKIIMDGKPDSVLIDENLINTFSLDNSVQVKKNIKDKTINLLPAIMDVE